MWKDDEFEALWREAVSRTGRRRDGPALPQHEIDAKTAARVKDLAHAKQARRAARAVVANKPGITDKTRLEELKNLFPQADAARQAARQAATAD